MISARLSQPNTQDQLTTTVHQDRMSEERQPKSQLSPVSSVIPTSSSFEGNTTMQSQQSVVSVDDFPMPCFDTLAMPTLQEQRDDKEDLSSMLGAVPVRLAPRLHAFSVVDFE